MNASMRTGSPMYAEERSNLHSIERGSREMVIFVSFLPIIGCGTAIVKSGGVVRNVISYSPTCGDIDDKPKSQSNKLDQK